MVIQFGSYFIAACVVRMVFGVPFSNMQRKSKVMEEPPEYSCIFNNLEPPRFTKKTPVVPTIEQHVPGAEIAKLMERNQQPTLSDLEKQLSPMQPICDEAQVIVSNFLQYIALIDILNFHILQKKESLVKRLKLQITTIYIPGKLNSTTDSLSKLFRSGDYTLKDGMIQMICKIWKYMATDRHIREQEQQQDQQLRNNGTLGFINTIPQCIQLQLEQDQTFYAPPIPTLLRVLAKLKQNKAQGILIAPIWPGQTWYIKLMKIYSKIHFYGPPEKKIQLGQSTTDKSQNLSPGNVGSFLLDLSQTQDQTYQGDI
ncbi:MAG: hypothetical protein EZS28_046815 [Streblomastix strix]|uniref:Uncharacterized protein n=1 Tax=Streblomastix strix TaxID=222440 RepID=A0A5J4THD3_9EUKA|nr:MAG: hypothetical protein EZS28_046815 [Streblomastix strix]